MPAAPAPLWKTLSAFAVIYLVWGSTFLAIRVGVHEVPPLLFAALRFFTAGALLFVWMLLRRETIPNLRQWGSIALLAVLIFVGDYGLLFWAEQRVPSGIAAVMMATIPAFTALAEIAILRTQRLTLRLTAALLIGLAGVAVLVSRGLHLGGSPISRIGACALIAGSIFWSVASVLNRKLPLPASKAMSSGAQMLAGGVFLTIAAAGFGELHEFHPAAISLRAWIALIYLVLAGSILGFTCYVWLIHHHSPTKVGTYAYVNPIVAVLLGYFVAGEPLGLRTIAGTLCVLFGVIVITTTPAKSAMTRT
jgi:drug/metabolite transporter (DMT)-like permease